MIVHFIEYDRATGVVDLRGTLDEADFTTAELKPGRARLGLPYAAFLGGMELDLGILRAGIWQMVRRARDRAECWGCATALGRADTDADSQRKVSGAVQLAMIAQAADQPFSVSWTMQDNSAVDHDASAMIALGVAVGQHVMACHAVALGKRAAIDAAEDAASILAVDPLTGWPDEPALAA